MVSSIIPHYTIHREKKEEHSLNDFTILFAGLIRQGLTYPAENKLYLCHESTKGQFKLRLMILDKTFFYRSRKIHKMVVKFV